MLRGRFFILDAVHRPMNPPFSRIFCKTVLLADHSSQSAPSDEWSTQPNHRQGKRTTCRCIPFIGRWPSDEGLHRTGTSPHASPIPNTADHSKQSAPSDEWGIHRTVHCIKNEKATA